MQIKNIFSNKMSHLSRFQLRYFGVPNSRICVLIFLTKKNPCAPLFRNNEQYYFSPARLFTFRKNPTLLLNEGKPRGKTSSEKDTEISL